MNSFNKIDNFHIEELKGRSFYSPLVESGQKFNLYMGFIRTENFFCLMTLKT